VYGIRRHNTHDPRDIPDFLSSKGAGSCAFKNVVDLHLPGMDMVADGAARVDADVVKTHATPGIAAGDKVPEDDTGKLRVRVPFNAFNNPGRPVADNRAVPCQDAFFYTPHHHSQTPDSIDNCLHIALPECRTRCLGDSKVRDQDILIDCKPLVVHDLLCAGNRAAVYDNPLVGAFTHPDQFFNTPANAGKARTATVPFGCQLARGCIRELPDIRSDPGT
jgi:hypothetical protein